MRDVHIFKLTYKEFYLIFITIFYQNPFFTNRTGMHIQGLSDLLSNINIVQAFRIPGMLAGSDFWGSSSQSSCLEQESCQGWIKPVPDAGLCTWSSWAFCLPVLQFLSAPLKWSSTIQHVSHPSNLVSSTSLLVVHCVSLSKLLIKSLNCHLNSMTRHFIAVGVHYVCQT